MSTYPQQHQVTSGNPELDAKIREWLAWDRNIKTSDEVRRMVKARRFSELSGMLMTRLRFGTAGLRGRLGVGYNAMNDLVVLQTAQGLLKYLEETDFQTLKHSGIVVGYDGRHGSKRFAELTATVFVQKSFQVRLFNNVVPTPLVPFTVAKYKCAAGIMVTASHNPREDNGYKVYGPNGAQIITPVDQHIETCILQSLEPLESSWDTSELLKTDKRINPLPEVLRAYIEMIKGDIAQEHKDINEKTSLKFVYTPLHGVGFVYFARAMDAANLKIIPVEEQKHVHPDFPTVRYPNPEEGMTALELAIKTAEANQSTIIIANDPDADRMACAEKDPLTGKWKIFTGNETGALLGWWALHTYHALPTYDPKVEVYMLASTVSSKILRTMSKIDGFKYVETLTGFKWIGNKAHEIMQGHRKKVVFAFEEAIGFMWNTAVLDKDGIQAGVHLATLAAYLDHHAITLTAHLDEIYQEYGYHLSMNSYFTSHDVRFFYEIFNKLRNYEGVGVYPKVVSDQYTIKYVRDLTIGYDTSQPGNKAVLPSSPDQQMITFEFDNGLVFTLRLSGTEPKLKFYTEICAKAKQG
ncbi:phosphomannomutase 45a [Holotrichia oblita]|uniref:Phosphomannomutase 45a n=3 Tax=Holotrichia oblita TaxID=644536 RepID=A0ACB9T4J3_HOLOL|nr:phosphomannomutase 45a [Holotrichia oblita]KAI4461679.1 phosphomannomutase 45a [Holotrichia oblita]KAI4461682.1 phosphomannomutase 45a [Holotrichia oblita]